MAGALPQTDVAERPASACEMIAALKEAGPIKVWSLLVTVFGDLSAAHGGFLTSRQLNGLFDAFDIQSGALRVALHRLRKEGWIESERIGRISRFKMTEQAQQETEKARPVVYRDPSAQLESWVFVVSKSPLPSGAVRLNKVMACLPEATVEELKDAWVMPAPCSAMPDWLADRALSPELRENVAKLSRIFDQMENAAQSEDLYQRMALRLLILHQWRRVALRDATWLLLSHKVDDVLMRCFTGVHRKLGELKIEKLD